MILSGGLPKKVMRHKVNTKMFTSYHKAGILKFAVLSVLTILFLADATASEWKLDNDQSSLTYLSSKLVPESLVAIFEPNRFEKFSGSITAQGKVDVTIDMASVKTGVDIRDQRVMEHVFMVKRYPQATVSLSLPAKLLATGTSGTLHRFKASLMMRGVRKDIYTTIRIDRLDNTLLVQSVSPLLVNALDYGMVDGFEKLRELVGLFNIPTTIPVSFSFVFTPLKK